MRQPTGRNGHNYIELLGTITGRGIRANINFQTVSVSLQDIFCQQTSDSSTASVSYWHKNVPQHWVHLFQLNVLKQVYIVEKMAII